MRGNVRSTLAIDDAAFDSISFIQTQTNLKGTNPLRRSQKGWRFIAHAHKNLLDLFVSGIRFMSVPLSSQPRANRLQRAVGTAPSIVVEMVLQVVIIFILALNQILTPSFQWSDQPTMHIHQSRQRRILGTTKRARRKESGTMNRQQILPVILLAFLLRLLRIPRK